MYHFPAKAAALESLEVPEDPAGYVEMSVGGEAETTTGPWHGDVRANVIVN